MAARIPLGRAESRLQIFSRRGSLAIPVIAGEASTPCSQKALQMNRSRRLILALICVASLAATSASPLAAGPHHFSSGGLSLWYRVAGRPDGIPVIFLHGGPGEGSQAFARTAGPLLERRLRMVYFDQRGAGHSDRPVGRARYTLAASIDDIAALQNALGAPRIAVIAHSFGTVLALEYAARFPQRVSRLVLVGALPDGAAATNLECARLAREDMQAYWQAVGAPHPAALDCIPFAGFKPGPAMGAYMARASGARAGTLDTLDAADRAEGVKPGGGPDQEGLAETGLTYRFAGRSRLSMPVLVLAGANDRLTDPTPALSLARTLPRGTGRLYAGAGHFLYADAPERFAADVTRFLSR